MNIDISSIQEKIDIIELAVGRQEYSGIGWLIRVGSTLKVYDFELLNVGSESFTEIKPEKTIELINRSDNQNMRLWVHKHPMGNGVPGPHNWSSVDQATCVETPMGGVPELVGWSAAIVHTLGGWVGRVDHHHKKKTYHVPVITIDRSQVRNQANNLLQEYQNNRFQPVYEFDEYEFGELPEEEGSWQQKAWEWIRSLR